MEPGPPALEAESATGPPGKSLCCFNNRDFIVCLNIWQGKTSLTAFLFHIFWAILTCLFFHMYFSLHLESRKNGLLFLMELP